MSSYVSKFLYHNLCCLMFVVVSVIFDLNSKAIAQSSRSRSVESHVLLPAANSYPFDMVKIVAEKIWNHPLNQRDLAILRLQVGHPAKTHRSEAYLVFKIRNGETISLNAQPLFGPGASQGPLKITGELTLAHPQSFEVVQAKMGELASRAGARLATIEASTNTPILCLAGATLNQPSVSRAIANGMAEIIRTIGQVGCVDAEALRYSLSSENSLTFSDLAQRAPEEFDEEFELLSFVRAARIDTCGRAIRYTLWVTLKFELREIERN